MWPSSVHRVSLCCAAAIAVAVGFRDADSSASAQAVAAAQSAVQQADNENGSEIESIVQQGIEHILAVQEGESRAEWPYEGVYRVRGEIPVGYRIGGTGICAMALLRAPGYADDERRHEAVARACEFILQAAQHPLMAPEYAGGYDVRGWGYTYGLAFLLALKSDQAVPSALADRVESTIRFFIDAIQRTEIPQVGGWNYSRAAIDAVSPPSPFMTAPTVQALFEAMRQKYEVDAAVVVRALGALEAGRTPSGSFCYAGADGKSSRDLVPGAVGRMLVSEATLLLAGRSSVANVRSAIDAFIVHWRWLDQRRAQHGTHTGPYGIAPYYFYFAHYYAAQAIEMLPEQERGEYRRRLRELIMKNRLPDGIWNDRVFERSSNYGTAMSVMALLMPDSAAPAAWRPDSSPN